MDSYHKYNAIIMSCILFPPLVILFDLSNGGSRIIFYYLEQHATGLHKIKQTGFFGDGWF